MRHLLHLKTRADDPWADRLIALQEEEANAQCTVIDLTATEPDYDAVLEAVWQADSVQVW